MDDMRYCDCAGSNGKMIRIVYNPGHSEFTEWRCRSASNYTSRWLYGDPPKRKHWMFHSVTPLSRQYRPGDKLEVGIYKDGTFIPED
jgi:hypothetical protein